MRGVLMGMVFLVVGGCDRASWMVDGGACPIPPVADAAGGPDMASPAPKCAAAKGLAGDNLLCVDFKDVQQLTSLTTWSFNCGGGASWTVMNGQLQVAAFKDFADTCTVKLPTLAVADYQKYGTFIFSLLHKSDLNNTIQRTQIMLGADDPDNRLLNWATGKQPRQRNTYEIAKSDIPLSAIGNFQPLLKISSSGMAGNTYAGWQIESISINGIP